MISRHNHPTPDQVYADGLNGLRPGISAVNAVRMEKGLENGHELYPQERPLRPYYADLPVCILCGGVHHWESACPALIAGGEEPGQPGGDAQATEVEERMLAA